MAASGPGLTRGAIGLREVLFQSVTSMAPAGAVALSIAAGATYAGGALPLAVLLALIACLLVASSIGQLAKHLPSAGSIYTYPAEAIHPALGFLVGWGYALVEALLGPITMVLFGYLFGSIANSEWHWPFTTTWVIFMIVGAILVAALNYRGIQVSARAGTLLGLFEIVVFVALAIWLIVKAGSANTLSVFTLHYATIKGYKGFSGIAAGSIYTILAFIGFEASAPLAEEARDPKRTIQIAVVMSCLVIGLFYVFTTYAGDVFTGPDKFVSFGSLGGGSPWIQLGRDAWGLGWVVVFLAIVNSTFANGNAGTLATTRTWYAMARIRLLPSPLARSAPQVELALGRCPGPADPDPGHRAADRHPLRADHRLRVPGHHPDRHHDRHLHGLQPVLPGVLPQAAQERVQRAAARGHPDPGHLRLCPRLAHRPGHRVQFPEVRYPAGLPGQRSRAGHRDLVHRRPDRPGLPVRAAPRAPAGDEEGLLRGRATPC